MKEEHRWHNRVELSLDNRQVFLLFFASAVVISLVFALGVVVGKRLEPQPARQGVTDPLAMLDQMGQDTTDEQLTFHETLSKGERLIPLGPQKELPNSEASPRAAAPVAPVAPLTPAGPAAPAAPAISPLPAVADKGSQLQAELTKPQQADLRLTAKGGKEKAPKQGKISEAQGAAASASASESEGAGSYTLQLSSFQERSEAEAFVAKLQAAGLKPYMVPATIPGRGMWYRVRLGNYGNWDAALSAKERFEQTNQIIAYVMRK